MEDPGDDFKDGHTLITRVKNTLLAPIRLALSPALLRTYLRTILILATSTFLFGIAVIAYTSFYVAYIPVRGISVPVYLQFDTPLTLRDGIGGRKKWPYGVAEVKGLVARQKYDVRVEMLLPRSRRNLEAGNWMIGVELRGPGSSSEAGLKGLLGWDGEAGDTMDDESSSKDTTTAKGVVLARSRRPAILTYRSFPTEAAYRFLRLPLYMIGWGQESEAVSVPVFESVEFEKGWRNVPSSLRLELCSTTPLEVYKVAVKVVAKLEGLRWVMYEHRVTSFLVFTTLFWAVEMGVVMMTWGIFTLLFGGSSTKEQDAPRKKAIKAEHDTPGAVTPKTEADTAPSTPRSDTSHTFPTLSSQQPLHFSSGEGKVKRERGETPGLQDAPLKTEAEADDEDEDEDFVLDESVPISATGVFTDSGVGTSMESNVEGRGLVRKRSKGGASGSRDR